MWTLLRTYNSVGGFGDVCKFVLLLFLIVRVLCGFDYLFTLWCRWLS